LTVVVPVYNERENLEPLHEATVRALEGIGETFEMILVNDGSKDGSDAVIDAIATQDPRVHAVHLGRNSGQTAAIMAGVHLARATSCHHGRGPAKRPKDIRKLLKKIDAGYDVCSGWRKNRKDHPIKRNLPSRAANWLISKISGVHLHDYGCSLKAYRADILKNIDLYGEMHRFIPIYAKLLGARVTETEVSHRTRAHGSSKYGLERVGKVLWT
jgi:glycosyltransferase involved in cell wall biosynthesis